MRNRRLSKAGKYLLVGLLIALLGLVTLDPTRKGDMHRATMSALLVQETKKATKTQILATLGSGQKVVVYGTADYREGARVTLQEYVTQVLDRHSYCVVSFEE